MANALPEFVGEGDEELFEGTVHLGPAGVGETAPREARLYPVLDQETLPVRLVLGAVAVELVGVQDLSGVVDRDPEPHELRVERDADALDVRDESVGGLAHKPEMGQEARWSAEAAEHGEGAGGGEGRDRGGHEREDEKVAVGGASTRPCSGCRPGVAAG